jgi:hypothetical protein
MAFSLSSPVTGAAQTGLTSPTYTLTADTPPVSHSKQYAVTALGGTQTGVEAHAMSQPFTIAMFRPAVPKTLGTPNPATGVINNIPRNVSKIVVRKGVNVAADQAPVTAIFTLTCDIPAGADVYDAESIRAALSCLFGSLSQQSAGIGDSVVTAVL